MIKKQVVGIVDYQSGNIRSVVNAVEAVDACSILVRSPQDLNACSHLVLPGVGAFGFCVDRLLASGLLKSLESWALRDEKPLLGICVGMQLMADHSEELGSHLGLGWIGGAVRKLEKPAGQATIRIPHVGWNEVLFKESFGLFRAGESVDFYFDHSFAYHAPRLGREIGSAHHGHNFCALIRRGNIIATQFHPEKSQSSGMRLLKSFLAM
jgi:glutamine amidotransferase